MANLLDIVIKMRGLVCPERNSSKLCQFWDIYQLEGRCTLCHAFYCILIVHFFVTSAVNIEGIFIIDERDAKLLKPIQSDTQRQFRTQG